MRTDNHRVPAIRLKRWLQLAIVFLVGVNSLSWGQAETPSLSAQHAQQLLAPGGQSKPASVPLHLLYRHFLAYQNHLDEVAASLKQQGEDGSEFRDHFRQKLGFTTTQYAPVRAAAQRLAAKLKVQDEKIKAVINAGRAQHPRMLRGPEDLPAPPPELAQLQVERDALIKQEVATMNAALGAKRAAQVRAMIESEVALHAQSLPMHSPTVNDPAKSPLSPFPNGVRQ